MNRKEAWERNFKIMRLRGMSRTAKQLLPEEFSVVQEIIDRELVSVGAETESDRDKRFLAERDIRWNELTTAKT